MKIRTPSFWWRPAGLRATLLKPFGALYGAITGYRMKKPARHKAEHPVVCIGNFVSGGAGKTPVALEVARLLGKCGLPPAFLTRGYGGRLAGPVEVDPERHNAGDVGDEPLLLARTAHTVVSRDRKAGAQKLAEGETAVIVMDDGFQSRGLAKTVSLVVVDGQVGVGNGACLPAGPLRAPLDIQIPHADAVILLGEGAAGEAVAKTVRAHGKPVFRATLEPVGETLEALRGRRVLAYAGIGRPEKFVATLTDLGAEVSLLWGFADHQAFRGEDAAAIRAKAKANGLLPVTTEKDAVRLAGAAHDECRKLAEESLVVPVVCRFEDEAEFLAFLSSRLGPSQESES